VWAGGNNGLASASKDRRDGQYVLNTDFCNKIGQELTSTGVPASNGGNVWSDIVVAT